MDSMIVFALVCGAGIPSLILLCGKCIEYNQVKTQLNLDNDIF